MKKLLLLAFSSVIAVVSFSQNSKQTIASGAENALLKQNAFAAPQMKFNPNSPAMPTSCDTLNWPISPSWTGTNYYTGGPPVGANGWVNGLNVYLDKEKAQYFDASTSPYSKIHGFFFQCGKAFSLNPAKLVTFRIYDGTAGPVGNPGATLATYTLTMGQLMYDVQNNYYSEIQFPTPVNMPASKKFFISADVTALSWTGSPKDTFNIVSNADPQTVPTTVWEKQSDNNWYKYDNAFSWLLNISMYIFPYITNTATVVSYTQNPTAPTNVCTGSSVMFDASASVASAYLWDFTNGTPNSSSTVTQSVQYNTAGIQNVKLYILGGGCPTLDSAMSTVSVISSPTVTATASPAAICPSGNSTLNAGGANTYVWAPGASLSSTTGSSVTATPTTTTTYSVTGTALNGCTGTNTVSVTFNQNPAAVVTNSGLTICVGQTVTFNASTSVGITSYSWTATGATPSSSTSSTPTFTYNTAGTYTVTLSAAGPCGTDNSYSAVVSVGCVGINESDLSGSILPLYNANTQILNVHIASALLNGIYDLNILNMLGQPLSKNKIEIVNGTASALIDLSDAPSGIYFLSLTGNNVNLAKKFVRE